MNKKGFFTGLIVVVVLLVVGFFWFTSQMGEVEECVVDEECVPEPGCHPSQCVLENESLENPDTMICTAVCSGPLDCGAGSCGCVNNKCEVIPAGDE